MLFQYDKEVIAVPKSDNAIGFDYKSDGLYMDSNGKISFASKYHMFIVGLE